MEFWAVEIKSGLPLSVSPGENKVLHLSQACLGEVKKEKGNEPVYLYVNTDGQKLVLGTLLADKLPQQLFDLVFDKDFELSHNWKNGSVFFFGYKADNAFEEPEDESDFSSDSEDSEADDIPLYAANNGKPEKQAKQAKPLAVDKVDKAKDSAAGKQKVKIVEPNKVAKPEGYDDSDESDDLMGEDESDSEQDDGSDEDEDDEEDEDSDKENEETPKKVESGKKRPNQSAIKTPGPDKKAKVTTPQKTDSKKGGGHVATPHPSKQPGKTPANKSNQSNDSHSCKTCNRTFKSEVAFQAHNQAKHSAGK